MFTFGTSRIVLWLSVYRAYARTPRARGVLSVVTFPMRSRFCLPGATEPVLAHAGWLPQRELLVQRNANDSMAVDGVALQHALRRLSHISRQDASRSSMLAAVYEFGVGATVHSLVLATLDSLGRNHTLFAPKLMLWSNPAECSRADLSCFFASLPSLDDASPSRSFKTGRRKAAASSKRATEKAGGAARTRIAIEGLTPPQWSRFVDAWFGNGSAIAIPAERPDTMTSLADLAAGMRPRMQISRHRAAGACRRAGGGCPHVLPPHFPEHANEASVFARLPQRYLRHGRFWLIAQTLHFLTRPNAALRHELQRERAALRLRAHQPLLALHVRKGDACAHRGECRGLADFMPEVRRVAMAYGIRAVFLSTPSADVRAETAQYPEFTWLFRNSSSAAASSRLEDGLLSRRVNALEEWRSTMIDVYLMAECEVLVGAFSSSAARLALALMASGPGGCLKPFASVDINWCFAYLRGGPAVIRRSPELTGSPTGTAPASATAGGSHLEREAKADLAARRVRLSGLTC